MPADNVLAIRFISPEERRHGISQLPLRTLSDNPTYQSLPVHIVEVDFLVDEAIEDDLTQVRLPIETKELVVAQPVTRSTSKFNL